MKINNYHEIEKLLRCPGCNSELLTMQDKIKCTNSICFHNKSDNWYKSINQIPILVSNTSCDTLINPEKIKSYIFRNEDKNWIKKIKLFVDSSNIVTHENVKEFIDLVKSISDSPKVLIIGSGEVGEGVNFMIDDNEISLVGIDVYENDHVNIVADAHYLPFAKNSFDGVWIQAVLEHCVMPYDVVEQIHRILKPEGIVYAETPFMQQVHEAAFDFTRYTVLGHRYLFRDFEAIKIGGNRGSDVVLSWSVNYFIFSISKNKLLGKIFGLFMRIILWPFKIFIKPESLFDSSSGVFFLGRRSNERIAHKDLVRLYKGML